MTAITTLWITLLSLATGYIAILEFINRSSWTRFGQYPSRKINYWLEDGVLIINNRSHEPIFDVVPFVWDPLKKERKVFRYRPSDSYDKDENDEGLTYQEARVALYAPSLAPGMWALELDMQEPQPKHLGLMFASTRGINFRLLHGDIKRRVRGSVSSWLGEDLSHTPELEFTRIKKDTLGAPFQEDEPEGRSISIMSSARESAKNPPVDMDKPVRSGAGQ